MEMDRASLHRTERRPTLLQHNGARLSPRRTRKLILESVKEALEPWPHAVFGLPEIRRRKETPGEQQLRDRIRSLMRKHNITQAVLAYAIGVSRIAVTQMLIGNTGLPRPWIGVVASVLKTTEKDLLAGIDWQPYRRHPRRKETFSPRRRRQEKPEERALRIRLRMLMVSQVITQAQIAKVIGVTRVSVSHVLTGRAPLPPAWLKPLATSLNLTVTQMIGGIAWTPRRKKLVSKNRLHA